MKNQFLKGKIGRLLAFFLTLSILVASFPLPTMAESAINHQNKIESAVKEAFQKSDYVTFIVRMKEQLDEKEAIEKARMFRMASEGNPETIDTNLRNFMVQELQETSEYSQNDILSYLQKQKKNGSVKEWESFFIVNSIVVTAKKEVADYLAGRHEVEKIAENRIYHLAETFEGQAEDTLSTAAIEENSEKKTEESSGKSLELPWNLQNIHLQKVIEKGYDGSGVVVGIIDSGADYNHPALKEAWRGNEEDMAKFSWLDTTSDTNPNQGGQPYDGDGHGSHVLGTILGKEAEHGMALGIAPKAKWMAAKVFDKDGETTTVNLLRAGQWMLAPTDEHGVPQADKAPKIVNSSWGGSDRDEFFRDVLKKWRAAGILPIFSAGNASKTVKAGPRTVTAPASYPEAFAVGAIDRNYKIAPFSLMGPSKYGEIKPEISAPGVNIKSSVPGGGYELKSGTSMASPHVAGVAVLLKQINPALSVEEIENILIASSDPRVDEKFVHSPNNAYGHGSLNAYRAMQMAEQGNTDGFGTLQGVITTKGENKGVPGIEHNAFRVMYNAYAFEVSAKVTDEEGIVEVNLHLKKENEEEFTKYPMELVQGTKLSGEYMTLVKPEYLAPAGQKMTYFISATDVGGEIKKTDDIISTVSGGITLGYHQTFEDEPEGFIFGGKTPLWQWGKPESGPERAYSGEKVVGTNLKGKYTGLEEAILISPVIDLTTTDEKVAMTFRHWYDLDNAHLTFHDTAEVWIGEVKPEQKSTDDVDFKLYRTYRYSQKDWKYEYIDLAGYKGKKVIVMFGLRYGGYSERQKLGWYIDDIRLEPASTEIPPTPFQYLEGSFDKRGAYNLSFYKIEDVRVTDYVLYRGNAENGDFQKVFTLPVDKIRYRQVDLEDYPKPQRGSYYYYATARIGENESRPTQIFKQTFTEGKAVHHFDFEEGEQGWTSSSEEGKAAWSRGIVDEESSSIDKYERSNAMPTKNTSKGKNDGDNVWGTELNDYRKPSSVYELVSPVMDISGISKGRIYFQTWFNTNGRRGTKEIYGSYEIFNEDIGHLSISKDGGQNWTKLFDLKDGYDEGEAGKHRIRGAWYLDRFDIPAEYLTDQFQVKFVLDSSSERRDNGCGGWYIDDFAIYDVDAQNKEKEEIDAPVEEIEEKVADFDLVNLMAWNGYLLNSNALIDVPVYAKVVSESTGLYAMSEPGSGKYSIKHIAGNHRFVVDEIGYKKAEATVQIEAGKESVQNFVLEPAEKGSLTAQITDENGRPLTDATVTVIGQRVQKQSKTQANGVVQFAELYAGRYYVSVRKNGYLSIGQEIEIAEGQAKDLGRLSLESIKVNSLEKELSYDTGHTGKYYYAMKDKYSVGVLFKADTPQLLKKVRFFFIKQAGKEIANQEFTYTIYGKKEKDGFAGRKIAGPFTATTGNGGTWTDVVLPENVFVEGDFYVAYTQNGDSETAPLLGMDDKVGKDNSFILSGNGWNIPLVEGAFMIRAIVSDYAVNPKQPGNTDNPSQPPKDNGKSSNPPATNPYVPETRIEENKIPQSIPHKKEDTAMVNLPQVIVLLDVSTHWARESIVEVVRKGLFRGTTDYEFSPSKKMTRAMLFTVLHRMSGKTAQTSGATWYASSMAWAKEKGISDGSNPMANITREQLITMLYRYAGEPAVSGSLKDYRDADKVSSYAQNAMTWAIQQRIITGDNFKKLNPTKEATRAEVAMMIHRYDKNVK